MNPDTEEQTRKFLQDLLDRRRRDSSVEANRYSVDAKVLRQDDPHLRQQQQQQQYKQQLIGMIQQRHSFQSNLSANVDQTAGSFVQNGNQDGRLLKRMEENTRIRGSSYGSLMDSMNVLPTQLTEQLLPFDLNHRGTLRGGCVGNPGRTFFPSLQHTTNAMDTMVNWNSMKNMGDIGFKSPSSCSSSAAAGSGASQKPSPRNAGHNLCIPRLKNCHFFLPPGPSSKKGPSKARNLKTPMKSYKALWRRSLASPVLPGVRQAIFSRTVAQGKVVIRDESRTLPPI